MVWMLSVVYVFYMRAMNNEFWNLKRSFVRCLDSFKSLDADAAPNNRYLQPLDFPASDSSDKNINIDF